MGKLARFACIFTPMVLSLLTLICLLIVFTGGIETKDTQFQSLYHYQIDLSEFKGKVQNNTYMVQGAKLVDNFLYPLKMSAKNGDLKDFYNVYLWDYCSGNDGKLDHCSPRQAKYFFNPIVEWNLNNTLAQEKYVPEAINKPMQAFQKGTQWLFVVYVIAFISNAAAIVIGMFAICSRLGSCITTIVACVSTFFTLAAAISSTVLFGTLVGAWKAALTPYEIQVHLGPRVFALDWLAVAFSLVATLFWSFSTCCVSGKSNKKSMPSGEKGFPASNIISTGVGKHSYQQLDDQEQLLAHQQQHAHRDIEMQDTAYAGGSGPYKGRESAYEPMRHQA
ncbi:integral membrane protein-like protein [Microthyrium microscopicum]|uniref:Integral membrane protein-like protein n=1 Tax=Microthyrium microscopicum TaxID=703497 RepID=A0A6A6U1I9_9PEZI|nr:integral membrane protein-like protein [Microthyrium microscopicum]